MLLLVRWWRWHSFIGICNSSSRRGRSVKPAGTMLLVDLHSSSTSVGRLSFFGVVLVELLSRRILIAVVISIAVVDAMLRKSVGLMVRLLHLLREVVRVGRLEWVLLLLLLGVVGEGRVVVSRRRRDGR